MYPLISKARFRFREKVLIFSDAIDKEIITANRATTLILKFWSSATLGLGSFCIQKRFYAHKNQEKRKIIL